MRSSRSAVMTAVVVLVAGFCACAEAGGDVSGAQITPEGDKTLTQPEQAYKAIPDPPHAAGDKVDTWTSLWTDYFGPVGQVGSCRYQTGCHGTPGSPGLGPGPVCFGDPPTDEEKAKRSCWESFTTKLGFGSFVSGDPSTALFFNTVRVLQPDGVSVKPGTIMPQQPDNVAFSQAAADRIKSWIKRGTPYD